MHPRRFEELQAAFSEKPHGTRLRYMGGCKCLRCRAANSAYEAERALLRRQGQRNGIVSADTVLAHIRTLSGQGIGYKTVADVARISISSIGAILSGRRKGIREQAARRILDIDRTAIADGALVDAAPAWKLLDELVSEGYTKAQLAGWLGSKTPNLQLGRKRITAAKAREVERLYRRIQEGFVRRDS